MNYYDLISQKQPLSIPFGEGDEARCVNVIYDRSFFCEKNSPRALDPDMTYIAYIIWCFSSGLIVSWDLKLGKKAAALTEAGLRGLSTPFLIKIYKAIEEDAAKLAEGSF